jgi:hypothetical protein
MEKNCTRKIWPTPSPELGARVQVPAPGATASRKPRHLSTTAQKGGQSSSAMRTDVVNPNPNPNPKVLNLIQSPPVCAEQQEQPCRAATVHACADLALAQHKHARSRRIPTSSSGPRREQAAQRRLNRGTPPTTRRSGVRRGRKRPDLRANAPRPPRDETCASDQGAGGNLASRREWIAPDAAEDGGVEQRQIWARADKGRVRVPQLRPASLYRAPGVGAPLPLARRGDEASAGRRRERVRFLGV